MLPILINAMPFGVLPSCLVVALTLILAVCISTVWLRTYSCEQVHDTDRELLQKSSETRTSENQESVHQGRPAVKQPYDAFLVLDVEGTCEEGSKAFEYPNEIIEWPVCLMRWNGRDERGIANRLEVVAEFRSFVKPTWRPQLSTFCTQLTGITQEQVSNASPFTEMLDIFKNFLEFNDLIEPCTGRRLIRYCWCSDGPFDICDFVVKQCFISKVPIPAWLSGDVLDVRKAVRTFVDAAPSRRLVPGEERGAQAFRPLSRTRTTLTIPRQLQLLGLASFQGRQHSGIDDSRNIARILSELARRGVKLEPNTPVNPRKRWSWMGKHGKVLEEYI